MTSFRRFILLMLLVLVSAGNARAFSLLGTDRNNPTLYWKIPEFDYLVGGDIGVPVEVYEGFRWNTPYITYGFDSTFLRAFGTNGVHAVEQAIQILNDLPPASQMNLDDFSLDTRNFNFTAGALGLQDVKSTVLTVMLEEMGLEQAERRVWAMRAMAIVGPASSRTTNYLVTQLNYDPYTLDKTAYINGALYTYTNIFHFDSGPFPWIYPEILPLDPLNPYNYSTVAGRNLRPGMFYSGLTRDDVGALRHLFSTNMYNLENLLPDVQVVVTNTENPIILTTSDYGLLLDRTINTTNDPATVRATYPGISLLDTNTWQGAIITTNIFTYFTNFPCDPQQVFGTNYVTNLAQLFSYELGGVVTNFSYTNEAGEFVQNTIHPTETVLVRILQVGPAEEYSPGLPLLVTNLVEEHFETRARTNGEFYLAPADLVNLELVQSNLLNLPTNFPGYVFLSNAVTTVSTTTNIDFFSPSLLVARTNRSLLFNLATEDLTAFLDFARTNDPTALRVAYPDLLILSSNRTFTNVVSSNVITYFTNAPFGTAGSFILTQQVVMATNIATNWNYKFGNVVSNYGTCAPLRVGAVEIQQGVVGVNPFDPAGAPPVTNVFISTTIFSNYLHGAMYIVPTNLLGYEIVSTQFMDTQVYVTNTVTYTNLGVIPELTQTYTVSTIRQRTNFVLNVYPIELLTTNDLAQDLTNGFGIYRETISTVTNHSFVAYPIELRSPTNGPQIRPGVDKVNFVRMENDIAFGTNFFPVTNVYYDSYLVSTNLSQTNFLRQGVVRVAVRPDIIFSAQDLRGAGDFPASVSRTTTDGWESTRDIIGTGYGLAGPGVIRPRINITLNPTGPFYSNNRNSSGYFLSPPTPGSGLVDAFGSFDGTTNMPVVYPFGASITNLMNEVLNPVP